MEHSTDGGWFLFFGALGAVWMVMRILTKPKPVEMVPLQQSAGTPVIEIPDEIAVEALVSLGFKRKAAIAALNEAGWAGNSTEERVANALRATPRYAGAGGGG